MGEGPNDVNIDAPTSVSPDTNFNVTMTVKNKNKDIGQDFILNYWLLSNDESTIYSIGTQTLYVGANDALNSTIVTFLAPSTAGMYRIRANVTGTGVISQATALLTVVVVSNTTIQTENGGGGVTNGEITSQIVCNPPYIKYGEGCCLDKNNNGICDKDEIPVNQEQKNEVWENKTIPERNS